MKLSKEEKALVAKSRAAKAALRAPRWVKGKNCYWTYEIGDFFLGSVDWNDGDYNAHHEGWWAYVPGRNMVQFERESEAKAFVKKHVNLGAALRYLKKQRVELNASIKLLEENVK